MHKHVQGTGINILYYVQIFSTNLCMDFQQISIQSIRYDRSKEIVKIVGVFLIKSL